MTTRSWYAGEVAGMLNLVRGEIIRKEEQYQERESTNTVVTRLIDELWRACRNQDENEHYSALWRATALLISIPGMISIFPFPSVFIYAILSYT